MKELTIQLLSSSSLSSPPVLLSRPQRRTPPTGELPRRRASARTWLACTRLHRSAPPCTSLLRADSRWTRLLCSRLQRRLFKLCSLLCEPSATTLSNVSLAFLTQGCVVQLQALSAAACPYTKVLVETPLGAGYISFIVLTVALSLYCGVGAGLKRYRSGASGIEAIPHIDLLRRAHAWVRQRMGWGGGIELGDYAAAEDEVPW